MTHLHISVPAITRGTLARTHELKSKIVPGLTAKQFCLSKNCFFVKSTEFSSLLGGKVLGSFALFSSEMSHKKGKGPSSLKQQSSKVQSN